VVGCSQAVPLHISEVL